VLLCYIHANTVFKVILDFHHIS